MTLKVATALEILARLQSAAPSNTASRLGEVAALIQSLSDENNYLETELLYTADTLPVRPDEPDAQSQQAEQVEPAQAQASGEPAISDSMATRVMAGMNDALRAPLVAIRGRAELIEAGMLGKITEEQMQWIKAIQENTDRSFRVLDAIERLIAIQKNEVRIDLSNFIASELLDEAQARVRDQVKAHQHKLEVQIPDNVPVAQGDFYQSMLVLADLLDNAIRYTPQGGLIRLSVDNLGSHVLFTVADNGVGLRAEHLDKVGSPFWRDDSQALVRQYTGTGLSLFLAKQLLALQKGELIFSGEAELGSTFSFTLATAAQSNDN